MRPRLLVPAAVTALALIASSCSSGADNATTASPSGVAGELQKAVRTSLAGVTSAHFVLTGAVSGDSFSGAGDQKLANGSLAGLQANATLPGGLGAVALVVDGKDRFVKVPPPFASAARPWLRLSSTSSNVIVTQLAGVLDGALAAGNLGGLPHLIGAARSVRRDGSDTIGTRYDLVVDPAKLSARAADPGALGSKTIPLTLWLDARKRPVQVTAKVTIAGQPADIKVIFGSFGTPVTITTPPASQIASG